MVKSETEAGEKQENEKRFKELRKICVKQEDRLQNLQATAFQLANYYFVFQGVVLTAICSGVTSLKCSDRWFLFTVSLLAALVNLVALINKGREYVRISGQNDKNWFQCNRLQKNLQSKTTITDDDSDYDDRFTKYKRYCIFAACMVLFIGFAVITLLGCWFIVCRKDDNGFHNKKGGCIKLCQGRKCIRICKASQLPFYLLTDV